MTQPVPVEARPQSRKSVMHLIAFQLRQHWFCLPLSLSRQIVSRQYKPHNIDTKRIQLGDESIPLVDTAALVYGPLLEAPELMDGPILMPNLAMPVQSIIVVKAPNGESVGLLIDGPPIIKRVPLAAISPVPLMYLTIHCLQGISSVVDVDMERLTPHRSSYPLFLLAIDKLLPPTKYS